MLHYAKGDMFKGNHDLVVVTVNCVGAMGKGNARQCRDLYPETNNVYQHFVNTGDIFPGSISFANCHDGTTICFMATKDHWRDYSKEVWVWEGLRRLKEFLDRIEQPLSVGLPPPGAGLGGLDHRKVNAAVEYYFNNNLHHDIHYYGRG